MPVTSSMKRAIGFAFQPTKGTPAGAVGWWAHYIEECDITDEAQQDVAEYERNQRATDGDVIPTNRYSKVKLTLRVDSREFVKYLLAGASYSFATSTHTLIWGDDPATFLTMWRYDGINSAGTPSEMRQVSDMILNTVEITEDYTAGTAKATMEFWGSQQVIVTSSLPTISYTSFTNSKRPFTARQSVLLRNGSAFCPITGKLTLNNNVSAEYCGPAVDPVSGDPVYQSPDELTPNKAAGTLDLTARYTGYAGGVLEDFHLAREEPYTLKLTDPSSSPSKVLTWTFPRFVPVSGHLDSTRGKRQRQEANGPLLLDDATGGLAKLQAVNADTAYLS